MTRICHCTQRLDCGRLELVLWSDESIVQIGELPQKLRLWRRSNKKYISKCITPKSKGEHVGIMVWACFTGTKHGPLVVLDRVGQGR